MTEIDLSSPTLALSGKQLKAAQALAQGCTIDDAAKAASVAEKTIRRWRESPEFAEAVREIKREIYGHAIAQVLAAADDAVRTLHEICRDKAANEHVRVSAAKAILDLSYKGFEQINVEQDITEIKARLAEWEGRFSNS